MLLYWIAQYRKDTLLFSPPHMENTKDCVTTTSFQSQCGSWHSPVYLQKTYLTRSWHMKGTDHRLWIGYNTVAGWQTAQVVKLTQTRLVCGWVEAVRHGEAPLDLNLPLRSLWAKIRCSCALPLCQGTSSFPTVTWPLRSERSLCGVAYVLLKEREPDLWDDEKVATLSHSSLYTHCQSRRHHVFRQSPAPLRPCDFMKQFCALLNCQNYILSWSGSLDAGPVRNGRSAILYCCPFFDPGSFKLFLKWLVK